MHQLDRAVGFHRLHKNISDPHRNIEIGEPAAVLGVDEGLDVRVVTAQHPHLRAAPGAGRLHRLARAVKHFHV